MECQQAAKEMCKQGWMNDACEPSLEELEVCLTHTTRSEEKGRMTGAAQSLGGQHPGEEKHK